MSTFQRAARPEGLPPRAERPTRTEARPESNRAIKRAAYAASNPVENRPAPAADYRPAGPSKAKPRNRPRTVDRDPKPVAVAESEGERLSKRVMALKGCSRTEAEQYIEGGWVMVNGVVVEDPPFRVLHQTVTIAPEATLLNTADVTLILNKPSGWLDGVEEEDDEDDEDAPPARGRAKKPQIPNARTLLTVANRYSNDQSEIRALKRHFLHLEADVPLETGASGLVVFTQDWRTTRKLSEDMGSMEHEMIVDVTGEVQPEALQRIARALNDERNPLPQVKFSVNSSSPELSKLRFAVKGAHPALIAYLCGKAGLEIQAMRRIRIGRMALTDLPVGQWRFLSPYEKF